MSLYLRTTQVGMFHDPSLSDSDSDQYSQDSNFDSPASGNARQCEGRRKDNDDENGDSRLLFSSEGSARHDVSITIRNKAPLQRICSQLRLQELAKSGVPVTLPKPPRTQPKERVGIDEFVIRQENMEKHRQAKLVRKKLQLEYEAKVEKRKCPSCKAIQSFDECVGEKHECQCGSKFEVPSSFHLRRFERRIFQSLCNRQQKIDEISEDRMFILHKPQRSTYQQSAEKKAALAANADDFLYRMQVDLLKRNQHLEGLRRKHSHKGRTAHYD